MERYDDGFAEERQRSERLVEEIIAGEHKIDKLPNSSAGFSGAAQAEYFSNGVEGTLSGRDPLSDWSDFGKCSAFLAYGTKWECKGFLL